MCHSVSIVTCLPVVLFFSVDPISQQSPLKRSASMRYTSKRAASDYLNIARKGGHHKGVFFLFSGLLDYLCFQVNKRSKRGMRSYS